MTVWSACNGSCRFPGLPENRINALDKDDRLQNRKAVTSSPHSKALRASPMNTQTSTRVWSACNGSCRFPGLPENRINALDKDNRLQNRKAVTSSPHSRALRASPMNVRISATQRFRHDTPNDPKAVILGHSLWQNRFGGNTNVMGRTTTLNQQNHTIVGVLPASFQYLEGFLSSCFFLFFNSPNSATCLPEDNKRPFQSDLYRWLQEEESRNHGWSFTLELP